MFGLDDRIAALGTGETLLIVIAVAVLLGLRHATDPDHVTAVATLTVSERGGARRAGTLGLAWGLGHGCTLFALGLPVVLLDRLLPDAVQRATEVAIGVVIVGLAVRLLRRWHRGYFHAHPHRHGDRVHAHPHLHDHSRAHAHVESHQHPHARTPLAAFGIGLLHGAGGSAGVGVLLVTAIPGRAASVAALAVLAAGTALSMALLSAGFGSILGRGSMRSRLETVAPALGAASLLFGCWYALGALGTVSYGF
jgi:ABC-type nickel/cobalt efflux system permease component RcnA